MDLTSLSRAVSLATFNAQLLAPSVRCARAARGGASAEASWVPTRGRIPDEARAPRTPRARQHLEASRSAGRGGVRGMVAEQTLSNVPVRGAIPLQRADPNSRRYRPGISSPTLTRSDGLDPTRARAITIAEQAAAHATSGAGPGAAELVAAYRAVGPLLERAFEGGGRRPLRVGPTVVGSDDPARPRPRRVDARRPARPGPRPAPHRAFATRLAPRGDDAALHPSSLRSCAPEAAIEPLLA